jgi:predicted porin
MSSKFANNGTLSANRRLNALRYRYKKFYGLALEQAYLLKQNPCEICGNKAKKMCIDHEHDGTSNFRGVLCLQCNVRVGWLETKKDIILKYLDKHKEK